MNISKFVKIPEEYILCHGSIFPVEKRIVKNVVRGILEYCVQAYENSIYRMNFSKDDILCVDNEQCQRGRKEIDCLQTRRHHFEGCRYHR